VEGARCRIFEIQGRRNIVIWGGTLIGARWGSPEWGVGILASDAQDLTIENTWFRDFYYDGILLTGNRGCERVAVRGVVAVNNRRTGLAIVHASDVTVEASTFSGSRGQSPEAGVNCEPNEGEEVRNVQFSGLRIMGNAGVGLSARRGLGAAVANVTVLNSVIERNGSGVVFSGVDGASIADNRVTGHRGQNRSGIILGDGTTQANVTRNWLQGNFRGILSSGATGVEIRENTVLGTGPAPTPAEAVGRDGIACLGGEERLADACIVANNTIRRPGANGITTRQVSYVQLLDNTIEDAGHRAIHLRGTGNSEVRGNKISGSGQEPPPGRYDAIELEEVSYLNMVMANEIHVSPGMRSPISVAPDSPGNWVLSNTVLP
jgi:parallel beta-helix repeat protein